MIAVKRRYDIKIIMTILVIIAVFSSSYVGVSTQNEAPVIFLPVVDNGGVITSHPVIINNDLHVFAYIKTKKTDEFVHIYSSNNEFVEQEIISDISDIEFLNDFIYNDTIYLIFKAVNNVGTLSIYVLKWHNGDTKLFPIITLAASVLYYTNYFKVIIYNNTINLFYNRYYGDNNQNMKIIHYYGLDTFKSEEFAVTNAFYRAALGFVIHNDTIWYIYQKWTNSHNAGKFGGNFGAGILTNNTFYNNPNATKTLSPEVVGEVSDLKVVEGGVYNDSIFTFVFFEQKRMFYGSFNGSTYINTTQTLNTQNNFYNFDLKQINGKLRLLLVTKGDANYVSMFNGIFDEKASSWKFSPVITNYRVTPTGYSYVYSDSSFVVLYNSTVSTETIPHSSMLKYRDSSAIALYYVTDLSLHANSPIISSELALYNPIREFFISNIIILIIAALVLITTIIILLIIWKRKKSNLKKFLYDTEQVGSHAKPVLIILNIWRYLINYLSIVKNLGFTNKKRTIVTLTGFVITGYLLASAIIISQSEQSAMVKSFYRAHTIISDNEVTAQLSTTIINSISQPSGFPVNYDQLVKSELYSAISGFTIEKYVSRIDSAYYTPMYAQHPTVNFKQEIKVCAVPDDSYSYLSSIITNGSVPQNNYDVLVRGDIFRKFGLNINGNLTIYLRSKPAAVDYSLYAFNVSISGIYERMTTSELEKTSSFLGMSNDIYSLIETANVILKDSTLFRILSSSSLMNIQLTGIYQFVLDFSHFTIEERTMIMDEQNKLIGKTFSVSSDSSSALTFTGELFTFFKAFNTYYVQNMSRLFIFAFPAILLSIFMIFESSELFSNSYVQEVTVMKNRGVKKRRVTGIYISIRFIEVIIATLVSYALAVITAIPLIKVNGFLSFNNKDTEFVLGNVPISLVLIATLLFTISIPRILMIINREKKVEKTPSKIIKIFKSISWRDVSFLLIGSGIFGAFYYLTFLMHNETSTKYFALFLNLTIIGALFALIGGLPILMKLLSILWRSIGTMIWRGDKKTKTKFVFAEIAKDIKYFENITLIFLLLIAIIIPSIIVPYSKETVLTQQAYFINGADIMIRDFHKYPNLSLDNISRIKGIASISYVQMYTMYSDTNLGYSGTKIVVINTTSFLQTAFTPPYKVTELHWEYLQTLTSNTVIVSKTLAAKYRKSIGDKIFLIHPDAVFDTKLDRYVSPYNHTMTITSFFNLFPVFFLQKDRDKGDNMMIVSTACFDKLKPVIVRRLLTSTALLIRVNDPKHAKDVSDTIFKETGGVYVSTVSSIKDSLKTPLYNIFIIEMILSMFVATIVLIFSSFTTATKILEKRVIKHDIMKKMGININTIVNLSAIESFIAAVLPSMLFGSLVGFLILKPMLNLLNYGSEPYPLTVQYPIVGLIIGFLALPVILYINLSYNLRREFAHYTPTQLE